MFKFKIILIISLFLLIIAKAYYDTNSLEIRHYQIQDKSLGKVLNGKRIAFLSDLHIKHFGIRESKILTILEKERPDLVILGGDYIWFKESYQPAVSFMQKIKAPLGVYGVLGNTEYSNENGSCILCHQAGSKIIKQDAHPTFLRNSSITLNINGKKMNLIGLDDPVNGKADFSVALNNCNLKEASLLISHSPEVFEEAVQKGINFVLCGHNHGGQIFILKYLRDIFHLDPALEFLDGFFQKGTTAMYVSRGVGTSFLPFRLGVKPEITFFTFCNENGSIESSFAVGKNKSETLFMDSSLNSFLNIFNFFSISFNYEPSKASRLTPQDNILFDFESDEELNSLNWECHKWFERKAEKASSGKYSLKVFLPPGQYPGINFQKFKSDWSEYKQFKMEVFNPDKDKITFHIRIDDKKSGWEYAHRFDKTFILEKGENRISIPLSSLKTNIGGRPMDLKNIKRLMIFIPNNQKNRELYIDNIRLE